jgi:hypothetical protein
VLLFRPAALQRKNTAVHSLSNGERAEKCKFPKTLDLSDQTPLSPRKGATLRLHVFQASPMIGKVVTVYHLAHHPNLHLKLSMGLDPSRSPLQQLSLE